MPVLKDIVRIQTGVYLKPDRFGNALYLQVKHFDDKGELTGFLQPDIFIDQRLSHHILQEGDVLFAAKGDKNVATVYREAYGVAVASSSFFVLRKSNQILPEYLSWFINHPASQKKLKAEAMGSAIPSISMKTIGNLEIKLLDFQTQRLLLKVDELRRKEKNIASEIAMLHDQLINIKILLRI